ncbi:mucin-19 [Anopheles maculipalpis]|uniref:mucin-19 n=1 Tax=Anopheles maculipalpis TaxID=1496333 RepID=UPI002158AC3C|nr:mucin-19 [Anopheles maculipalpis]
MVIGGEQVEGGEAMPPSPQQFPPQKATIENIMSGIENTGAVKMNNHRKKLRQRFDIIKKLGQGTYGKVQLGINKETGQEVAIKTIKKSKIETEADLIRIRREVQIMSSVYHPNIIHIYEVFENREKMILVMEFAAGGELYDYLSERKVLAEEEARRIFRQVSTAIYYCHKHKICHRDLKLENILLDENGNAKIADFGLSNVFDEQRLLATFCGSPLYASPEIVKGTPYQGPEVDCWSLGVLLYTLVYGAMPFDGANFKRLVKQISQGDYFEPKKPSRASPLIREMLTVCPSHRANIEQICNHWWVNEGYDESCLDLAEELANQTPVRLDVLLSLSPPSVMADQLVVGNGQEDAKAKDRIQRSHSMGSIVDMGGTEAERRILDMVAAGGEAALMPSPTRTITPAEAAAGSPAQTKRKLETTVSTENATGAVKKKDKADPPSPAQPRIPEDMDVEETGVVVSKTPEEAQQNVDEEPPQPTTQEEKPTDKPSSKPVETNKFEAQEVLEDLQNLENMCDELLLEAAAQPQAQSSESNSTASKGQSETVPANGAATAAASPGTDTVAKPVSSVRAKLEKLEKGDTDAKPVVPTTTIPAVRKIFGKNKTTDLTSAINEVNARKGADENQPAGTTHRSASSVERKNSLPDESLARTAERRKSRILETAEKFQNLNQQVGNGDKFKKFVLPGGGVPTVGNYKKEFERKTGLNTSSTFTKSPAPQTATLEQRKRSEQFEDQQDREDSASTPGTPPAFVGSAKNLVGFQQQQQQYDAHVRSTESPLTATKSDDEVKESDSKSSVGSFSLEDARRSMENSIAMLNRVKTTDSSAPTTPTSIDQLCARTESVSMMEDSERERKLKNAREIIGNAIPIGRLRKPPMPFGANGRSTTGTLGINKPYRMSSETPEPRCDTMSIPRKVSIGSIPSPPKDETKTSHAEITLKSATLPRRKLSKPLELQGDPQLKADQRMQHPPPPQPTFAPMRFSTEFQHQMPDLRSAPIGRDHPPAFAPMAHQHQQHLHHRANSLEPQGKEQQQPGASFAGPQKPPTYQRTTAGYGQSPVASGRGSLSRQSTNESNDSDNTISQGPISTNASGMMSGTVSTSGSTTMPIKKSPREYIIPIAVEGGGIVTPRANSLEPSESNASSSVSGAAGGFGMKPRLGRPRRLGSLLAENDTEAGDITSFPRLNRHTSLGRESDSEEPKFHMMHRLRSTRPSKRGTADPNESASSGEEDDDDGFEILTAENLFSTLLSRVRALTNRLNVNDVNSSRFPASRFMNNLRQTQTPFWHHQDPFGRNLTDGGNAANAWRHSMSRDLSTDIDSMFSRSGATLPRGARLRTQSNHVTNSNNNNSNQNQTYHHLHHQQPPPVPPNSSSNSIRSSYNNRYSYHHQPASNLAPNSTTTSSFYKDLASLAAYGNGVGSSDSRDSPVTSSALSSGVGGGSNDDESSISSTVSTGNGNGYRHQLPAGEPDLTAADGGSMEENLDLRDLDLSQLRLSKRDLETLSSITPALSQRVQEQLLAQLPPQQARKLSRTLSMQNGGAGTSQSGSTANQRLYRRSYSNSSGNRSLDSTAEYGTAGSGFGTTELRRRGGSQPRDILSPPPAYQTPAPLYEKYAPYGTSIPTAVHASAGDSSGMSAFVREYDNTRKPLSSPHTTLIMPGTRTTTPLRYTSSPVAGSNEPAPTKRLSRFLRPDFFDPPKEMIASERDTAASSTSDRNSPYSSGGVTLREGATDRLQRREKLANDTITDRLSYFLDKYGKPDDETVAPIIGDRTRRSVSRSRDLDDDGAKQPEQQQQQQYRTPAETLSILQEQLQDLTNITSLAAGNQMSKLLRGNDDAMVPPASTECQLPGCTECEGKQEDNAIQATNGGNTGEAKDATAPVKKIVKVKKVKIVKKAVTGGQESVVVEKSAGDDTVETTPPTVTVVKKVKKVDPNPADAKDGSSTLVPVTVKKESKLMRPKSYPYKETVQDGAKLSVAGEIELESSAKPATTITPKEQPPTEVQTNGSSTVVAANGVGSSTVSKIARPKSFPSSKLTPPKELKLLKSPVSEAESLDSGVKVEPTTSSVTPTTPVVELTANGAATTTTNPPKKVKKVIRIVKKVTKTTDSTGKVVVTTTTMPVDGGSQASKSSKESTTKTVTIKEEPSVQSTPSSEKQTAPKEKSKSPEKKPKQGFLASIGQRFEKFRDTSRSSKEKKAAAAAAAVTVANATTISVTSNESLPDTAVPAMVPGSGQIVDGVTPDVLKPSEPISQKKDKKKSIKPITKVSQSQPSDADVGSTDEPIAKTKTTGTAATGRKSRIDTVIKNLRELSAGPKLPELTESKLIKRAVSVEEMPGTFNRCSVTKVLGLFKKIEKDSRNNVHHRLLNTKSSSHIMMSGRSVDESILAPMPDLMQPVPVESGRMRNGDSLLPGPTQQLRQKMYYGGARSDTVLPMDSLLSNGVDSGDYEQRKLKVASGVCQSQIPVKYGCPGCDTGCSTATGSSHTTGPIGSSNGGINGVHVGSHGQQTTTETGSGSNGISQRPPPQDTDRRGRARALTIDLEQAVHSATEKLKRLQQANSIHLSNNIPTPPLLHHHNSNNNNNNNYISNPSKTSLNACSKTPLQSSHCNTANGTTTHHTSSTSTPAAPVGGNNNYSYPPPLPGEMAPPGTATSPGGYNSMANNNINNNPSHHYSTLTPSYDSITNYSSGSRSSPYDDNSSSTFLSPSEERELYFDSWSVCSDELIGPGGGTTGTGRPLNSSSASPAPSSSAASRRHSSVRLLTSNPPLHSVSPVDPDAESVIERIRRKSFYTRFNDTKKPAKRASASNLGTLGGTASGHMKDATTSYGYYGNATSSSGSIREKSLSRGGSTSYILRPNKESSFSGVGKYDTSGYATLGRTEQHHRGYATMVNLTKANRSAARLRNSSLDVVPLGASTTDYQHHQPPPHYHHHHHHHHRQAQPTMGGSLSRTGSRLLSTDDDPLTDGLNYNNLINNNTTSNHKYTRNTYYESTAVPSSYGTYTPRRRSSFVASGGSGGGGYAGSSNIASSSSSIALDLLKDHARDGSASHGNLATTASSSSSNTLSASDNYGLGSSNSSSTASRTLRPYETRSSSLLTPSALREAGRYSGRYDSGTLTNKALQLIKSRLYSLLLRVSTTIGGSPDTARRHPTNARW